MRGDYPEGSTSAAFIRQSRWTTPRLVFASFFVFFPGPHRRKSSCSHTTAVPGMALYITRVCFVREFLFYFENVTFSMVYVQQHEVKMKKPTRTRLERRIVSIRTRARTIFTRTILGGNMVTLMNRNTKQSLRFRAVWYQLCIMHVRTGV